MLDYELNRREYWRNGWTTIESVFLLGFTGDYSLDAFPGVGDRVFLLLFIFLIVIVLLNVRIRDQGQISHSASPVWLGLVWFGQLDETKSGRL